MDESLSETLRQLYPKSIIYTQDTNTKTFEDLINEYNKLIND